MMAGSALNQKVLAGAGVIMGTVNLVMVTLPEGWELHTLRKPDIDYKVVYGKHAWASVGASSYHMLVPAEAGRWRIAGELEVDITARPGAPLSRLFPAVVEQGEGEVNGHRQEWVLGYMDRSVFFLRRRRPALLTRFDCPHTKRSLQVCFLSDDLKTLRPLLGHLADMRCH